MFKNLFQSSLKKVTTFISTTEIKIINLVDNTIILLRDNTCLNRIQVTPKLYEDTEDGEGLSAGAYKNKTDQPGQMEWSQLSFKIL